MPILDRLTLPGWDGVLEIAILAAGFYYLLLFIHGTRGAQVLTGLALIFAGLIVLTYVLQLETLTWILQRSPFYIVFAVLIIFQTEIRRFLAEVGRQHFFSSTAADTSYIDSVVNATVELADQKIGALIAIERNVSTVAYQDTGTAVNAAVTSELLATLFFPRTPLHDGGVIIRDNRIAAAGCVFPLSQKEELSRQLGTRHRAAIGLTEETDAVVVVVSEETGAISVALNGRLRRGLDEDRLIRVLNSLLNPGRLKAQEKGKAGRWNVLAKIRRNRTRSSGPAAATHSEEQGVSV